MRIEAILTLGSVAILIFSGCISPSCIFGSGNIAIQNRTVDKFNSIELDGAGDLYLTQGPQQPLRIEAEDNIINVLKTEVSNGKLRIYTNTCIMPRKPIKIYASAEELRDLAVSGSGNITSRSRINSDGLGLGISGSGGMNMELKCRDLRTSISGSGSAILRGVAVNHSAAVSGSGKISSYDLLTNKSKILISGSGLVEVNVQDELDVQISGSGEVYYKGKPAKINQAISGSGTMTNVG